MCNEEVIDELRPFGAAESHILVHGTCGRRQLGLASEPGQYRGPVNTVAGAASAQATNVNIQFSTNQPFLAGTSGSALAGYRSSHADAGRLHAPPAGHRPDVVGAAAASPLWRPIPAYGGTPTDN